MGSDTGFTIKAIAKAFSALYVYDYLLTIGDEVCFVVAANSPLLTAPQIRFAWKGRKTWCSYSL